jgi:hypothetical protein
MTFDSPDDRAADIRALIAHRAPELTDDDIASLASDPVEEGATIPVPVADEIVAVIEAFESRLAVLEHAVGSRLEEGR